MNGLVVYYEVFYKSLNVGVTDNREDNMQMPLLQMSQANDFLIAAALHPSLLKPQPTTNVPSLCSLFSF